MPQELYQELLDRLARLRSRKESLALHTALLSGLTAIVLVVMLALLVEAVFHLPIPGRTIVFWSAVGLGAGGFFAFVTKPLLVRLGVSKRATDEDLARAVGSFYPTVSDRLVNSLQLARPLFATDVGSPHGSPAFALAAFQTTYSTVRDVDFNAIVDERPRKRALLYFLLSAVAFLAMFFGFKSDMYAASDRLIHHRTFYQKPAPFVFHVLPGDARVMRGDSIRVTITTDGEQLPLIHLHVREEGQKQFDQIELRGYSPDTGSQHTKRLAFQYSVHAQRPVEYFAEAREIESERYHISVLDHPIVRSLSVVVTPPAYTREKPRKLDENIGDISGVVGTRASFTAYGSKQLKSAVLVFSPLAQSTPDTNGVTRVVPKGPARSYPLSITDSIAKGDVTFSESGSYHIDLFDVDGVQSDHPIEYTVTIARDEPPMIALIDPSGKVDIPSNMRLSMLARIRDDYGFRGVKLGARIVHSKYLPEEKEYKWQDVPLSNYNTQELDVPYIWNMTSLTLSPEDEVAFVMEVSDNDAVTGPKTARTAELIARFPSVREIFDKAEAQANQADKDMKEIKQDATELQKKINEAMNEMKQMKSQDIARQQQDFQKQKDVQQILQRQEELNKRLENVAKDVQEMTKQLEQQQAITPETMEKYQELQKLFQEINSPELKKAMEKLQDAMKSVDPKQIQEAMKNMQFNEENFRKSIERTANILKKIQMEQKVDELMKKSGELAKQEQKLADEQRNAAQKGQQPSAEQKAAAERQQQDAKKELDRMREDAKQLAKDMSKLPENMQAPDEMQAAQEALNDPSIDKSMEESGESAKSGESQRSQQRAQDAAGKMKGAQQKMRSLKQKLSENEKQKNLREMKQIRDQLNQLSKDEESLKKQSQQANQNSNVFRDLAEKQAQKKEQLGQVASQAMQLAQRTTEIPAEMGREMGEAFNQMQQAQQSMSERDQQGSQQGAQNAMTALNKAAQQAQQAMKGMQQGGNQQGGSGGQGEGEDQPGGTKPGEMGQGQGSALQQFLSQINQAAQAQQQLNDQMQNMAQGQQGGAQAQREMMRQQAQMAKIAAQQQAVQKSIEDLAREQQEARSGDRKAAENLQKIADEMQEVISQMKSSGIRPETVQRQERILSRLLEAQRSTHERDKEEQRESKEGENVVRESPRDIDLSTPEARKQLQDEIQRARETGYSKDYDALIRKYFDALEKQKARDKGAPAR